MLVSWRPPLEPNGIIISYRILYSGNLTQPDHSWEKLSQKGECQVVELPVKVWKQNLRWTLTMGISFVGSITSIEVQGLSGGSHYFFKLGAATEVGPGPYSPVKDIRTPLPKYGKCQEPHGNTTGHGYYTNCGK